MSLKKPFIAATLALGLPVTANAIGITPEYDLAGKIVAPNIPSSSLLAADTLAELASNIRFESINSPETYDITEAIKEQQERKRAIAAAIQNAIKLSPTDENGFREVLIAPEIIGYLSEIATSFTASHIPEQDEAAVLLIRQEAPGGEETLVSAHLGLDPAGYLYVQNTANDVDGIHPGQTGLIGEIKGGKWSENARIAVMFDVGEEGRIDIREIIIGIGYDMLANNDITLELEGKNGKTITLDANQFQVVRDRAEILNKGKDAADHLVAALVIKEDEKALKLLTDTMLTGDHFKVIGDSHMDRTNTAEATMGPHLERHLQTAFADKDNADFPFKDLSRELKRLAIIDTNHEITDKTAYSCSFLSLTAEQKERAIIYEADVTDGTGPYPRTLKLHLAFDKETGEIMAFGEPFMWGINAETGVVRISGSINTTFTTAATAGTIHNGCTVDKIYLLAGVTPNLTLFRGINPLITGINPSGFFFPGGIPPFINTGELGVTPVPLPAGLALILGALGFLGCLAVKRKNISSHAQPVYMTDENKVWHVDAKAFTDLSAEIEALEYKPQPNFTELRLAA